MGTCSKSICSDTVCTPNLQQNHLQPNQFQRHFGHFQLYHLPQVTSIRSLAAKRFAATTCSDHLQQNRPFAGNTKHLQLNHLQRKGPLAAKQTICSEYTTLAAKKTSCSEKDILQRPFATNKKHFQLNNLQRKRPLAAIIRSEIDLNNRFLQRKRLQNILAQKIACTEKR